jgi:hypothetical protein
VNNRLQAACFLRAFPLSGDIAVDDGDIKAITDTFRSEFMYLLKEQGVGPSPSPPPMIWHYTNVQGVMGILGTGKIFATNYRYVNDLTECIYANKILVEEIELLSPSQSPLSQAVLRAILDTPEQLLGAVDIYIACFCEDGDVLSQWQAYGRGGYAIGLGVKEVTEHLIGGGYGLYRVHYEQKLLRELIQQLIVKFCSLVDMHASGINIADIHPRVIYSTAVGRHSELASDLPEPLNLLCRALTMVFIELACSFKDRAFEIEEEWRLVYKGVSQAENDASLRIMREMIVPYKELVLFLESHKATAHLGHNFSLNKIIFGPGMNPQVTTRSLRYLTRGFPAVEIEQSNIQVRL